ncbi:glycosyltransferase family 9 protein, partial [Nitratifractor sp.]
MRIALVRLTALGDVIHTAASLQFVKAALPDTRLTWFVEEKFAPILAHNPHVDTIVPLDLHGLKRNHSLGKIASIRRQIKAAGPFDLVIDVQGLIKSAVVSRLAGSEVAGLDRASAR